MFATEMAVPGRKVRMLPRLMGWLAVIGCAVATIHASQAQQGAPRVTVPSSGACPTNLAALRQPGLTTGSIVQVMLPEVRLYQDPGLKIPLPGEPARFGQRIGLYLRQGGADFVKVGDRDRCGWLDNRAYQAIGRPLATHELPGWSHIAPVGRTGSGRGLVVNAKVVAKGQLNAPGSGVPLYSEPKKGKPIASLGYLAIMEVYKVTRSDGITACEKMDDDDCFALVGGTEEGQGGNPLPALKGWVEAKDVEVWPTSVAVFWRPGRSNIVVYDGQLAARNLDKNRILASQRDRHTEPPDRNIPRFPILRAEVEKGGDLGRYLYGILMIGEACVGGVCQGKVGDTLNRSRDIDVLFVVDATESMDKYFRPTAEAVKNLAEQMTGAERRIRFEAVVYGDYKTEVGIPANVQFERVAPFGAVNNINALQALVVQKQFSDPHLDKPEAPFAALVRAIDEARWRDGGGLRWVVWVGDHGNRGKGRHKTSLPGKGYVDETMTRDDVVAALRRKNISQLFALQVRGSGVAAGPEMESYNAFWNDAEFMLQGAFGAQVNVAEYRLKVEDLSTNLFDARLLRENLDRQFRKILEHQQGIEQRVENLMTGRDPQATLTLPVAEFSERFLRERGLTDDVLRKLGQTIVGGEVGWIRQDEDEARADFDYWIATTPRGFRLLSQGMIDLCDALKTPDFKDEYTQVLFSLLQVLTGDQPRSDETIADFLERKWSVPKRRLTPVLDRPMDRFLVDLWENKSAHDAFRTQICIRKTQLDYAERRQKVSPADLVYDRVTTEYVLKPGAKSTPYAWSWAVSAGIEYYFIPLSMLP
jgi:hypothetical protein